MVGGPPPSLEQPPGELGNDGGKRFDVVGTDDHVREPPPLTPFQQILHQLRRRADERERRLLHHAGLDVHRSGQELNGGVAVVGQDVGDWEMTRRRSSRWDCVWPIRTLV